MPKGSRLPLLQGFFESGSEPRAPRAFSWRRARFARAETRSLFFWELAAKRAQGRSQSFEFEIRGRFIRHGVSSLPVEVLILAHWPALSGMYFSRLHELLANHEELVSGLAGWARRGIEKFLGRLQRPQPRVCKLFWSVFGLGMLWPENSTCVFLGKNEGSPDWPRRAGRPAGASSYGHMGCVAFYTPLRSWLAFGLGRSRRVF